jgi:hypothetical protein
MWLSIVSGLAVNTMYGDENYVDWFELIDKNISINIITVSRPHGLINLYKFPVVTNAHELKTKFTVRPWVYDCVQIHQEVMKEISNNNGKKNLDKINDYQVKRFGRNHEIWCN